MEIAPGVHQIPISRVSHCFAITEPVVTLIDSGTPKQGLKIASYLADLGLTVNDARRLVLTHHDIDHIGSAQELHRITGMDMYMHPLDVPYALGQRPRRPLLKRLIAAYFGRGMHYGPPRPTLRLADGNVLDGVRVIHTPGHTPGHVSLLYDGVLFAGDAIITGDTFYLSPRLLTHDPEAAKQSARKLLEYEFDTAVSGHGKPTGDAHTRLEKLVHKLG
ncbi:MAG: MBL fold metallo-hydrolase [Chloroflexia bacterium]